MLEAFNATQAVAFTEQSQDIQRLAAFATQGFKKGIGIGTESVQTGCAVKASFHVTVNLDVAGINLCKITTPWLITPLAFEFHDTSPLNEENDTCGDLSWTQRTLNFCSRLTDTLGPFHGLAIQHLNPVCPATRVDPEEQARRIVLQVNMMRAIDLAPILH
jgi:hypothetical protein